MELEERAKYETWINMGNMNKMEAGAYTRSLQSST